MRCSPIEPQMQELAAKFWTDAGEFGIMRYDLTRAVAFSLPLDLVLLSRLTMHHIEQWLEHRGVQYRFPCESRALRGCLLVYRGAGIVFVDGSDPREERHYTFAHEVAHFLVDYWLTRLQTVKEFGPEIIDVLDGQRSPHTGERLDSILLQVSIEPYVCLVEREAGRFVRSGIWAAENRADRLALELLAPADEVRTRVCANGAADDFFACRAEAQRLLLDEFELPIGVAEEYARRLAEWITGGPSVLESWGL
ncbi:MAG: hypothetical protein M3P51_12670 [Chloroflexota bacterium]|nr:hypothetical protein [Chloroflexota bacterium]